jgi:hypothetical protein
MAGSVRGSRVRLFFTIMTDREQIEAFVGELQAVIHRFRSEFNLPVATAIGCIEMVKLGLFGDEMEDDDA